MLEHDLEIDPRDTASIAGGQPDTKEWAALAMSAAACASLAHEMGADLAGVLEAIRRLSGSNQLICDLAGMAERMADELCETMEDTRTQFILEAERQAAQGGPIG
ncbi:hypothetical protein OVY01_18475 [Robbsia sp. Bb-Pol-6]|uniref:Uncharacterized protein n=1 Tax=Robbsia betulipollinis TaxID=2981849 RepID=A0ABT3ZT73_9BURK|nr:hypothetical protein [Robbsia betulipollinis]MCY0389135.1 hypothetical protein [Robbsia betulipollinis]